MNRTTLGTTWRETAHRISRLWGAKSVAEAESLGPPASTPDEDFDTQEIERVAVKLSPQRELEAKQQSEALSTWEDEGGASIKSKKTVSDFDHRVVGEVQRKS